VQYDFEYRKQDIARKDFYEIILAETRGSLNSARLFNRSLC